MDMDRVKGWLLAVLLLASHAAVAYEGTLVRSLLDRAGAAPGAVSGVAPGAAPGAATAATPGPPPAPVTSGTAPTGPGAAPVPNVGSGTQAERLSDLNKAYANLVETCEGRFGVLNSRLRKQVVRAETVSIVGGFIGVLGAIATCPHCAALASGLAGLANPLQQTFRETGDAPQDTRLELRGLADQVRSDIDAYRGLPPPVLNDPAFEVNLARRIDALRMVDASCRFYSGKANSAGEGEPAKP